MNSLLISVTHDKKNSEVNTHPRVYVVGKFCKSLQKHLNNFTSNYFVVCLGVQHRKKINCAACLLVQQFTRHRGQARGFGLKQHGLGVGYLLFFLRFIQEKAWDPPTSTNPILVCILLEGSSGRAHPGDLSVREALLCALPTEINLLLKRSLVPLRKTLRFLTDLLTWLRLFSCQSD